MVHSIRTRNSECRYLVALMDGAHTIIRGQIHTCVLSYHVKGQPTGKSRYSHMCAFCCISPNTGIHPFRYGFSVRRTPSDSLLGHSLSANNTALRELHYTDKQQLRTSLLGCRTCLPVTYQLVHSTEQKLELLL